MDAPVQRERLRGVSLLSSGGRRALVWLAVGASAGRQLSGGCEPLRRAACERGLHQSRRHEAVRLVVGPRRAQDRRMRGNAAVRKVIYFPPFVKHIIISSFMLFIHIIFHLAKLYWYYSVILLSKISPIYGERRIHSRIEAMDWKDIIIINCELFKKFSLPLLCIF